MSGEEDKTEKKVEAVPDPDLDDLLNGQCLFICVYSFVYSFFCLFIYLSCLFFHKIYVQ